MRWQEKGWPAPAENAGLRYFLGVFICTRRSRCRTSSRQCRCTWRSFGCFRSGVHLDVGASRTNHQNAFLWQEKREKGIHRGIVEMIQVIISQSLSYTPPIMIQNFFLSKCRDAFGFPRIGSRYLWRHFISNLKENDFMQKLPPGKTAYKITN